jgi:predicted O-methyltransferase YrrM
LQRLVTRPRYPQMRAAAANRETIAFLKTTECQVVAEIGVAEGHTSQAIAQWLDGCGELHLFDFGDRVAQVEARLRGQGIHNVVVHANSERSMDSYNWSLMRLLQANEQPILDYVFLDGAHVWTLDALAFLLVDRLLKPGGYIDFDDYEWSLAISSTLAPAVFPATRRMYTDEQIAAKQVKLIVDLLVRRDPRYEEVVANKVFRKRDAASMTPR